MGRAFEYRKATKLKRWGHMAKTFTKIGKQIAATWPRHLQRLVSRSLSP